LKGRQVDNVTFTTLIQAEHLPVIAALAGHDSVPPAILEAMRRPLLVNYEAEIISLEIALGFWAALPEVYASTREQRCWVHKTANVLNKLPKAVQPRAKSGLHEIYMAETRAAAEKAFDLFVEQYGAKYPRAVECLAKDREALLAFYDFPAEHWTHIRTTNAIESIFDTVRHRHRKTKGSGSRAACLTMVFKLVQAAEKKWRRLTGAKHILKLLAGYTYVDGVEQERNAA